MKKLSSSSPSPSSSTKVNKKGLLLSTTRSLSLSSSFLRRPRSTCHPHLPLYFSLPDRMTRFIGTALPLHIQHSMRNDGGLRSIVDTMATLSCPLVGVVGRWEGV